MTAHDLVYHFPMQSRDWIQSGLSRTSGGPTQTIACSCGFRCSSIEDVARKMWAQHVLEVTK